MAMPASNIRRRNIKSSSIQVDDREWSDATTRDRASILPDRQSTERMVMGDESTVFQTGEALAVSEAGSWSLANDASDFVPTNVRAGLLYIESPTTTSKPQVHEKRTDTLAIVLGIVFGLVFLLVVLLVAFLCIRRRKKHGSFIYQDNVSVASVDSYVARAGPDMTALQKDVSTASSSPERASTQPATALETITEKSSGRTTPTYVQGQASPAHAVGFVHTTPNHASYHGKPEAFPTYYPPLPAPHQLSSPGRRHSTDFAYVPNDPFYDSNIAIYDLYMQQQRQQQQQNQPQHSRTRSRGSLSGQPSMMLAPLREYPEHNEFREPRNPLPQDPREQALYNYRNTPDHQLHRTPSGHYRRPRVASLPPAPDQHHRSSPDMSTSRPSVDPRIYRPSPEMASYRPSPDLSTYRPSPEIPVQQDSPDLAYRHSPDMSLPRRSFESPRRTPELQSSNSLRASPRVNGLHHPIPKPVAIPHNSPAWPWPPSHPASMGLPPTSNPIQSSPAAIHPLSRSITATLTPAAKYRAEMMRYKQRQNHRRWTSEPHLLASNMRHPSIQRKPVPLPRRTPIPPLEQVKLPAFWWEQQPGEDIGQSVEDLLIRRQQPLRRFSFESRPVILDLA